MAKGDKLVRYMKEQWMSIMGIGALIVIAFFGIYNAMGITPMFTVAQNSVLGGAGGMAVDSLLFVGVIGIVIFAYSLYKGDESDGFLLLGMYLTLGAVVGWIVLTLVVKAVQNVVEWLSNPIVAIIVLILLFVFIYTRGIFQAINERTKIKSKK